MSVALVRKPATSTALAKLTEDDVMANVSAILGYKVGEEVVVFNKATQIMKEHGVEPFDSQKVKQYKQEEAEKVSYRTTRSYGYYRRTITVKGVWKTVALEKYTKAVPAFALLRAAELKKAFNLADIPSRFYVEELQTRRRVNVVNLVNLDPFMVVEVGGKKLYIDVWNEPKFEGRRTK